MLVSGILLLPVVRPWTIQGIIWDWQTVLCVGVVIIIGTVLSFGCSMEGVRLIGGTKASLFASIEPLTATVISILFMGVAFSWMDLFGFVGIIGAVTIPVFVIFLEPYLFHEKLKKSDVFCTLMMLVGVFFIVPAFQMDNQITQGVLWGLLSAFTYAVLSLMNRRFSCKYPATLVSLYEQGTATIVLIPTLFVLKPVITLADAGVLMMLGIIFTAVAHSLFIGGLRTVKVRTAGILSGLEPVYGTLSAFLFLKEVPSFRECLGGVIILVAVFLSTLKPEEKEK